MKKLIIMLFSLNSFAQELPHSFSSGELIDNQKIDNNMRFLETYGLEANKTISLSSYIGETKIKSEQFNSDIEEINSKLTPDIPITTFNPGDPVSAAEVNSMFAEAKAYILNIIGESCFDLLAKQPDLETNENGFYKIKPIDSPDSFWAFCDMQNGGWTLLFDYNMAQSGGNPINTPASSPVYIGDDTRSDTITVNSSDGNVQTINFQDLQKAVKYVKGTYLRFPDNLVAKSSLNSTFRSKVQSRTPWTTAISAAEADGFTACDGSTVIGQTQSPAANIIFYPAWDYAFSGTNTYMRFLAGCHAAESYSDRRGGGIAAYVEPRATSCFGSCYIHIITARPSHRGIARSSAAALSTWIK